MIKDVIMREIGGKGGASAEGTKVKRATGAVTQIGTLECGGTDLSAQTGAISIINSDPALYPRTFAAAAFVPSQSMMGRIQARVKEFP